MNMNINEKKALYAFGCPNREATVQRLRLVAALAPDPAAKKLFFALAVKLNDKDCDRWYRCFFYNMRVEMERFAHHKYVPDSYPVLSRINSVLRRTKNTQNIISYHDLVVDTNQATVVKNGTEILLSAMEYKLLLVFLRNKGIVLSRRRLLELLWDTTGEFINDNTLTVYMKRLRDKIETNPQEPEIIITVRGLGYKVG